jgi:hydroxyethylthiazole kinase
MKESLWQSIISVRKNSPLVHNITNYVVMNNTANALLAAGASPIMAHAHAEVQDMVALCSATVINIGTLDDYWVQSMLLAAQKAHEINKPWVLDPVGAGATTYRDETVAALLAFKPTVIRGNASEIMALAKMSQQKTKGVDSVHQSTDAVVAAKWLNANFGSVVCVSGATDVIVEGSTQILLTNGHPLMQQVTGLGCTASALVAAFVGNEPMDVIKATAAAMALLGVAGQLAEKQSAGPGSLQMNLLDKLYNITKDEFYQTLNAQQHNE